MKKFAILFILFCITSATVFSQQDSVNIRNLTRNDIARLTSEQLLELPLEDLVYLAGKLGVSIEELLNQQVTVASRNELSTRETPGIISVINRDEIVQSGARDLIDLLELIPGISFGYDLDGVIGMSMRGIWGLEGKILVMIDGIEINEGMYTTVNFGHHFSPEQIERIEIIRGPGSSLYGGYAELGVINIITRNTSDISGYNVHGSFGTMEHALGRQNIGLQAGKSLGKTDIALLANYSSGNRTDFEYTDFEDETYSMGDNYSKFHATKINLSIKNSGFTGRMVYDRYSTNITGYEEGATNNFSGLYTYTAYTYSVSEKFKITPRFQYRRQLPYNLEDISWFYRKAFNRFNGELCAIYDITEKISLNGGAGYYYDLAKDLDDDPEAVFSNDEKQISYNNFSTYLQGIFKLGNFNLTGGIRFDNHNEAGTNVSPRVGVTAIFNNFHFKLLYSNAFRTPSVENLNLNPDIEPEKTAVIEFETGYKINSNMFVTANLFDITIKDPIIYEYNPDTEEEFYSNYDKTGTKGFEFQYKILFTKFNTSLSYSYYNSSNKNTVDAYMVYYPDNEIKENILQGNANHKIGFTGTIGFGENSSLSTTLALYGKRYGFIDNDSLQTYLEPLPVLNVYFNRENFLVKNLRFGVGIFNLFNNEIFYIQPYGTPGNVLKPYPGGTREYIIRLSYTFGQKK